MKTMLIILMILTFASTTQASITVLVPDFKISDEMNKDVKFDEATIDFGSVKCKTSIKFVPNMNKSVIQATFSKLVCNDGDVLAPEININLPAYKKHGYMLPTNRHFVLVGK